MARIYRKFNKKSRKLLPTTMGGQRKPWIRNAALALVLHMSRIAGVAPFVFTKNGPRVSLALTVYGRLLISTISGLTIWLAVKQITQSTEKSDVIYNAKTTQFLIQWLSFTTVLANIISVFLATGRVTSLIEIAKRVETVKTKLDTSEVKNKEKQVVVLHFVTFALFFAIESYCHSQHMQLNSAFIILRTTQLIKCVMLSVTSIQLTLTCRYICSLFPSYNNCLRQLLQTIDDKKPTDLIPFRRAFGKYSHIHSQMIYVSPRSLNTVIDRIGLFQSTMGTAESMQSTLWHLNVVYTEICALVDIMNHHHNAITILLMLIVYTISLIATLYHAVNKFVSIPLHIPLLLLEAYWFLHHLTHMCLIIDCGHRIISETIEIKRTVSKLIGIAVFLRDECVDELNNLFVKLTLMEPMLSPLNLYTLSRGLIMSIIGAAATYSVIVVQFRSSEI